MGFRGVFLAIIKHTPAFGYPSQEGNKPVGQPPHICRHRQERTLVLHPTVEVILSHLLFVK
jgi:hypothetical protein